MMASQVVQLPAENEAGDFIARARALLPGLLPCLADARQAGDFPAAPIAAIKASGLFRAFQPKRWGGYELDPRIMLDVQNVFAERCLSLAWIFGVLSVQSFMLGRMDPLAQADVWGEDPDVLVSSSFTPVGQVTPAAGGYRLSGRFTFSSGSSHAGWAMVGGIVPPQDTRPAQMRLFLVPRADYRIDKVWDTIGLRATGSNDLIIEDVFVPAYRTYVPDSGLLPLPAQSGLPALYRLPWLFMFATTISNLGVGAGRGALAAFTETVRTRRGGFANAPSRENPAYLAMIGRARCEIDLIDAQNKGNFTTLLAHVDQNLPLPLDQALVYRAQLTGSLRRIARLVDEMMLLLGGRGIRTDDPLTQVWLDMAAARAHPGNDPGAVHAQLAGELLGPGA